MCIYADDSERMKASKTLHGAFCHLDDTCYRLHKCGLCVGEPYRDVRALCNGDLQHKSAFDDRVDWTILSRNVAVYIGESSLKNADHPLLRACEKAIEALTVDEHIALNGLSKSLGRPAIGNP